MTMTIVGLLFDEIRRRRVACYSTDDVNDEYTTVRSLTIHRTSVRARSVYMHRRVDRDPIGDAPPGTNFDRPPFFPLGDFHGASPPPPSSPSSSPSPLSPPAPSLPNPPDVPSFHANASSPSAPFVVVVAPSSSSPGPASLSTLEGVS